MARRELHDKYFKLAKAEGYLARSAYKLLEIDKKKSLIKPGFRVLDLGCSPGSWLQVATKLAGPRGRVVGIDLKTTDHDFGPRCVTLVGDAFKVEPTTLTDAARGMFNVVLSDMAPNTTGDAGSRDHYRSVDLCRRVLELSRVVLKPGGSLAMKVFEGGAYPDLLRETGRQFKHAKGFKPDACRDVSREIYIIGKAAFDPGDPKTPEGVAKKAPKPVEGWSTS